MGLCKRRAKPESGPRETGRRRSNEGNRSSEGNSSASQGRHPSSCPTSPACKQPNLQPNRQSYHHSFPAAHARVAGPEQKRVALRTVADSGKPLSLQPFGSACPSTRSGCAVPCGTSRSQTRVSSLPGPANPALCAPGRLKPAPCHALPWHFARHQAVAERKRGWLLCDGFAQRQGLGREPQ